MEIKEITLLSKEEYEACKEYAKPFDGWWWLRSPGVNGFIAACVMPNGGVDDQGMNVDINRIFIRPALRIDMKSSELTPGKEYRIAGQTWTAVSDTLLLCDKGIRRKPFREDWGAKDSSEYEKSDVKKYLESWASKRGIRFSRRIMKDIDTSTILYDNNNTRNSEKVQRLKGSTVDSLSAEDLLYMAPFVCPAKTEYDIRKNPYIRELCKRAGTLNSLMSDDREAQKRAVDTAYKTFGSCLEALHEQSKKRNSD